MPALLLTPASIGYLNQVILAALICGYLLSRFIGTRVQGLTRTDWELLAIFASVILMSAAFFFEVTLLPAERFVAVAVEIPLTVLLLAVLVQFSYDFPKPVGGRSERIIALGVAGGYTAYEILYAVQRLQGIGTGQITFASEYFDVAVIVGFVWIVANFVRGGLFPGRERTARRFALVFCIPVALAVVNLLNSIDLVSAPVYYIALTIGILFTFYLFTLTYLAAKPDTTTLAIRIIGAMITGLLSILGTLGWLVAPQVAQDYAPNLVDHRSLRFEPVQGDAYQVVEAPFAFQSDLGVLIYPQDPTDAISDSGEASFAFTFFGQHYDGVFINKDGALSFGEALNPRFLQISLAARPTILATLMTISLPADAGIYLNRTEGRLVVSYVNVASFYHPRNRYTFQITLDADGAFTLTTDGLPEGPQYFVNDRPDAAPWALGITPGSGAAAAADFSRLPVVVDARGGIQNEHMAFRQALHAPLLPLAIGSLVVSLVFSIGFGLMIHYSLTAPLTTLLGGVKAFRRTGRAIELPVVHNDEVGFLTSTFNAMSVELRSLIQDLEARVAARTAALSAANLQLSQLSTAVEQSADSIMITDLQGRIEYVNRAFYETTGYTPAEVLGANPRILKSAATPPALYRELWACLTRGETWSGELLNRTKQGDDLWESVVISPIRAGSGAITHFVAVKENITERKRAEQDRERLIALDPLTGLFNRRYFFEAGEALVGRAQDAPGRIAALMLDIDNFKQVNDTYGHQGGDAALREVAHRISSSLRGSEIVARYGGEEFVVLLTRIEPADVEEIAARLVRVVNATPIHFEGARIRVSISLGAAFFTDDIGSLDALLSRADRALYQAKHLGRNRWVWWDDVSVGAQPVSA